MVGAPDRTLRKRKKRPQQMRWPVDEAYPDAMLALNNLNTHKMGSLYEAFEPAEARRIAKRLEFHHTPKHGSWLNMAEMELSMFGKQALKGRVADEMELRRQIGVLEAERNEAAATIHWRFTTLDARRRSRRSCFHRLSRGSLETGVVEQSTR